VRRRIGFALAAALACTVAGLLLAEGAALLYVSFVAERGRLFEPDPDLGWALIPDLDRDRRTGSGERWNVRTNGRGFRSLDEDLRPEAARRVLILGDSFAFGEGVRLEDRFDSRLAELHPDWSIVNQGVMGYGPDQQLIAARSDIAKLREGDLLLIVSYVNDFFDLLRRDHSGRAKPWFELQDGELVAHPPRIGLIERIRDRSYLLARAFRALEDPSPKLTLGDARTSGHLYRRLIQSETTDAVARGVSVLIAYHGRSFDDTWHPTVKLAVDQALRRSCSTQGISCVDLDSDLMGSSDRPFQPDGHWNARGNAIVAERLARVLARLQVLPSASRAPASGGP